MRISICLRCVRESTYSFCLQNLHLGVLHRCLHSFALLVENFCYRLRKRSDSRPITLVVVPASCVYQRLAKDGAGPDAVGEIKPRNGTAADALLKDLTSRKQSSFKGLGDDMDLDHAVNSGVHVRSQNRDAQLTQSRYSATSRMPSADVRMSDM